MKIKIKSFNGELPSYLTLGKEYRVIGFNEKRTVFHVDFDNGDTTMISLNNCLYLNDGSWEIVSE